MKQSTITRLLSLLLALLLLGSTAVCAQEAPAQEPELIPEVEENVDEGVTPPEVEEPDAFRTPIALRDGDPTDAELIEQYQIPDNWARPALIFAVRTGLMTGRGDGTLSPTEKTTRAEVATMLMRVLKLTKTANLSKFTDVRPTDWFYEAMSQAVAAGLFNGMDNNTLMPNSPITREQAFAVLARMFGVSSWEVDAVYSFSDGYKVGEWARPTMVGMIKAGYVHGSNNKLNPRGNITRQELAQVLYNLLTGLGTELPSETYTGRFALAAKTIPAGTVVKGDLLLSTEAAKLELERVTVTGRLTIQGSGDLSLTLKDCSIGNLALCRPTNLLMSNTLDTVTVMAQSTLLGNCKQLNMYANTGMTWSADKAMLYGGTLTLPITGHIGKLTVEKGNVVNDGTIDTLENYAKGFKLTGSGSVGRLFSYKSFTSTSNKVGATYYTPDPGINNVTATRTDSNKPTAGTPKIKVAIELKGFGEYPRTRYFTAEWRLSNKLVKTVYGRTMVDGKTLTAELDFWPYIAARQSSVDVSLTILYENQNKVFSFAVPLDGSGSSTDPTDPGASTDISGVRTQNVKGKLAQTTSLYAVYDGSNFSIVLTKDVASGTELTILESNNAGTKVQLKNGSIGWVARSAVIVVPGTYYTAEHYTKEVKEGYVNQKGFTSKTNYLVWVSLWTQEVCIFQGSKGNWKLVRSEPCSTGANENPTPVESVEIQYRAEKWTYSAYYCPYVSAFDSTRGFCSWPITNGTTATVYDSTLGKPNSNGNVILKTDVAKWIYDTLPLGTAVEIY